MVANNSERDSDSSSTASNIKTVDDPDAWTVLDSKPSRRQVGAVIGGLLVGGSALAVGGSEETRAAVSVESLEVSDAQFESEQVDPVVDVTVAFEYATEEYEPQSVEIDLLVGESVVASESLNTSSQEGSAERDISGRVVDSSAWSLDDFAVERGESIEREISVAVEFAAVLNGSDLVSDRAEDTATVVVEHPQDAEFATIGGEGSIRDASEE